MTQRARRRHRRSRGSVGRKILLGLAVIVAVAGLGVASVGFWILDTAASAPSINELQPIDKGETSVVYAADGSRLGYIQSDDIREPVELDRVPDNLQQATVAIEDENFYEHNGIDYEAIVRAAWKNIEAGDTVQGGSTITQQLVRNLYIANPEDTIERKIVEAKLASELEDEHSKNWILEQYLNTASYGTIDGRTAIGVETASQTYFSKSVDELDLPEAALLAGLPQAPSEYNPFLNPRGALERRNEVLQAMERHGYITPGEYEEALQADLQLNRGYRYTTIREPYFFDYVEQELIDRYGVNTVRKGGLEVHTTINPRLQEAARQAITSRYSDPTGPGSALVSIDVASGNILAMASSGNYQTSQFNLAAQGQRQPGSSFKPFVLATAVREGIDPDSTYYSGQSPVELKLDDGTTWTVNNAEGGGGGTMSLRQATVSSVNVVYAQLDLDVGPEDVRETAYDLGITSPLNAYPAEGIGGLETGVTPLEMANAYGTFANGGIRNTPTAISRVVFPDGELDVPEEGDSDHVISDGMAYEVTNILEGVVTGGTGTAAYFGCPAAGKTGTTDDYTDAWFVGYTPRLSTAVWVGYPNAKVSMGSGAYGGTLAAPVWHDFMVAASGGYCEDFPTPENPAELTGFYGGHTMSQPTRQYPVYEPAPAGDGKGDRYPSDLYAPGAGEEEPTDGGGDTGDGDPGAGDPGAGDPGGGNPGGNPGGGNPGGGSGGTDGG